MNEFIEQLVIVIPRTVNHIIKLENELNSIDDAIKVSKICLKNRQEQFNCEKVKHFLDKNVANYQQEVSNNKLSKTIGVASELTNRFERFENEIFEFKKSTFTQIQQMINDYIEMNNRKTICLTSLLEKTKDSFKTYDKERKQNIQRKHDLDSSIPQISQQLNQRRNIMKKLEEKFLDLHKLTEHKQKMLNVTELQFSGKQPAFENYQQENQFLKDKFDRENIKIVETKSQVRKLIFEYLNKIKRLETLTNEKNQKMNEFKNVMKEFSKEGIARLNEKLKNLKLKLNEDMNGTTINKNSNEMNSQVKDETHQMQPNTTKLIKQLKDKNLKDKVNYLDSLYVKVINKYENEIKKMEPPTDQNPIPEQNVTRKQMRRAKKKTS